MQALCLQSLRHAATRTHRHRGVQAQSSAPGTVTVPSSQPTSGFLVPRADSRTSTAANVLQPKLTGLLQCHALQRCRVADRRSPGVTAARGAIV